MKTFGLSILVALGTLIAMAVVGLAFFTGGGIIFPSTVAWVAASAFAFERRPRHLWLHVAAIGVMVAALLNLYFFALPRLFQGPEPDDIFFGIVQRGAAMIILKHAA